MPSKISIFAKSLYKDILNTIITSLRSAQDGNTIEVKPILQLANKVVEFMAKSSDLSYYAVNYYEEKDLCVSHAANVAIFAVIMGKGFDYSKEKLNILCAGGILHDIGFAKIPKNILIKEKSSLTKTENQLLEKHCHFGYELIKKDTPTAKHIAEMVLQHHEKNNGKGYPDQLIGDEISRDGQILSLIDVYEALIHPRNKRDNLFPPIGINQILTKEGDSFSKKMLKALIEQISIYPIGVYVKLCSNEIGRVIETNKTNPMRPKVEIQYNAKNEKVTPHIINLLEEPLLHIEKCVPLKRK